MKTVLINYDYSHYPFTTASYLEMAGRRRSDVRIIRRGDAYEGNIDLVLNVEPVGEFLRLPNVPCHYYEIDNHVILGGETWFYAQADLTWLAQWTFRPYYEGWNIKELALAHDPEHHKAFPEIKEDYDIGFIGNDTYPERRKLLDQLSANYNVMRTTSDPGIPYSKALSRCKIIFNCAMNQDINMRVFEGIGIQKLFFTDRIPHLNAFFEEDEHFIAYTGWKELKEKVDYYLARGCYRRTIARQGAEHARSFHTYDHRFADILKEIS